MSIREDIPHPGAAELERTGKALMRLLEAHPNHVPTNDELAQELGVHPDLAEQWKMWFLMGAMELELEERGLTFIPGKTNDTQK